jgi:hypothetical protein
MPVYADPFRLLHRAEHAWTRADSLRATVSRHVEATARPVADALQALSRARASAARLMIAAHPFWQQDLLIATLRARGHLLALCDGETPHLIIDGVHATFDEAKAFHRGVVTLADIEHCGYWCGLSRSPLASPVEAHHAGTPRAQ